MRSRFCDIKYYLLKSFLLIIVFACLIFSSSASEFIVKNTSGVSRKQEPVLISRESLSSLMRIPKEKVPVLYLNRQVIPSQADDLSGDGEWDELAFQIDIERNSEKVLLIRWVSKEDVPEFPRKVFVGLSVKKSGETRYASVKTELRPDNWKSGAQPPRYQYEGPFWESEKVAFRTLFDERFFTAFIGKSGPCLLQDTFHLPLKPGSGRMEVIPFDSGLGVGGFAVESGGKFHAIQKAGSVYYRLLGNGPVRAVFDLIYEDWMPSEENLNVRQRISIWAGEEGYKSELQITGFEGEKELLAGLSVPDEKVRPAVLSLNKVVSALYWHGPAGPEEAGKIGMALFYYSNTQAKPPAFQSQTPGFLGRSCSMVFRVRSGDVLNYYVHTGWQKSDDYYTNPVQYRSALQQLGNRLEFPLQIGKY